MTFPYIVEQATTEAILHHIVDGVAVPFTTAECAEFYARIAAHEAARPDRALADLRVERNARLAASDWTQAPDAPTANVAAWKVYRQALRDLPQRTVYPNAPQWPTAP